MVNLRHRFDCFEKEQPQHSSLINFSRAINGQDITHRRVIFYFNRWVNKDDYALSDKKNIQNWLISKTATQKQGYFAELGYKTEEFSPA